MVYVVWFMYRIYHTSSNYLNSIKQYIAAVALYERIVLASIPVIRALSKGRQGSHPNSVSCIVLSTLPDEYHTGRQQ